MLLLRGFWSSKVFNTVATTAWDVVVLHKGLWESVLPVFGPLLCVCVWLYACGVKGLVLLVVGVLLCVVIFVGWLQPLPRMLCVLVGCVVSAVYHWLKNKGSSATERCMGCRTMGSLSLLSLLDCCYNIFHWLVSVWSTNQSYICVSQNASFTNKTFKNKMGHSLQSFFKIRREGGNLKWDWNKKCCSGRNALHSRTHNHTIHEGIYLEAFKDYFAKFPT